MHEETGGGIDEAWYIFRRVFGRLGKVPDIVLEQPSDNDRDKRTLFSRGRFSTFDESLKSAEVLGRSKTPEEICSRKSKVLIIRTILDNGRRDIRGR